MATTPTSGLERPLPPTRNVLFLLLATLLVALFYVYSALFLIVGAFFWLLLFVLALLDPQFRGKSVASPLVYSLGAALRAVASALFLKRGHRYGLTLRREQAPRLWEVVEDLSRQINVAPPQEFVLEGNCNAYVNLRGITAGRGKTKLGVGLDLLAGLSEAQVRAIMAHEIAHAKYVRRGYQIFLKQGLHRVNTCSRNLQAMRDYRQNTASTRLLMRVAGALPEYIATEVGRLNAACSRYEEFHADRVAAEICGPAVFRAALLGIDVVSDLSYEVEHRERLLRIEHGPGYANWLRESLQAPDEARRMEIEKRALEQTPRYELSSHPALPDRLAAIDQIERGSSECTGARSGLVWLSDPDEIATQLLRQIEQAATRYEADMTQIAVERMRRWGKGTQAVLGRRFEILIIFASVVVVASLIWLLLHFLRSSGTPNIVVSVWQGCFLLAGLVILLFVEIRWIVKGILETRDKAPVKVSGLPIPSLVRFRTSQLRRKNAVRAAQETKQLRLKMPIEQRRALEDEEAKNQAQSNVALGARLRASVPAEIVKPNHIAVFHIKQGYEALARDDITVAAYHARLALEIEPCRGEAIVLRSIFRAICGQENALEMMGQAPFDKHDTCNEWASAWLAALSFDFIVGEAFLIQQISLHPENATLRGLLAICQSSRGKVRESLVNARIAFELMQKGDPVSATRKADEVCHRFMLVQNLTQLGQLKEARVHLDWLAHQRTLQISEDNLSGIEAFSFDLEELKWRVAAGQSKSVISLSETLTSKHGSSHAQIAIGNVLLESREESILLMAQQCFERALQSGFYPNAKVSLAQLLRERGEDAASRILLLEALNLQRKVPYDAPSPTKLLTWIFNELRAIEDAPLGVITGWEIRLDATDLKLKSNTLTLLCLESGEAQARIRGEEIFAALMPDKSLASRIEVSRASPLYQSDEPRIPGVYQALWGTDFHF